MNRGLGRLRIFERPEDLERFHRLVAEIVERFGIEIHAFCLMGTHYHLLVRTPEPNLSDALRHLDGVYTQSFNRAHGRDGPLFRGRFRSVLVQADKHLVCAARYVHRNPVEAGLVERPEDWPHSSYRAYLDPRHGPTWLRTSVVLGWFGSPGGRARHRRFVEDGLDPATRDFFGSGRVAPVLGSAAYRDEVAGELERTGAPDPIDVPDVGRVRPRPPLSVIARCVAEAFDLSAEDLRPPARGRGVQGAALARGLFVELAVNAGRHRAAHAARWLGYRRATSAASARRRFQAALLESTDLRARSARALEGVRSLPGGQTPDDVMEET